jgi:fatty acid-binding protein DegV
MNVEVALREAMPGASEEETREKSQIQTSETRILITVENPLALLRRGRIMQKRLLVSSFGV